MPPLNPTRSPPLLVVRPEVTTSRKSWTIDSSTTNDLRVENDLRIGLVWDLAPVRDLETAWLNLSPREGGLHQDKEPPWRPRVRNKHLVKVIKIMG